MSEKFVSKENFFREVLVPTGTIAEALTVILSKAFHPSKELEHIKVILWTPLNFVSHYVLNTPDDTDLTELRQAVLNHRKHLLDALEQLPYPLLFPQQLLSRSMSGTAKALYSLLGVLSTPADHWLANLQRQSVPSELRENADLWRTFSQNLERGDILTKLRLPEMASLVSPLGTEAGREQAQALWNRCFPSSTVTAKTTGADKFPGPALPQNIAVVLLPSGFLEVTAIIDPKRSLTISGEGLANLPARLAHKLEVQRKVVHCAYTRLAEAVAECQAWLATHRAQTANLQAEYDHLVELRESAKVLDRLKEQFSDEEIAVIRRHMGRQGSFEAA
jgi:hypothetical protein